MTPEFAARLDAAAAAGFRRAPAPARARRRWRPGPVLGLAGAAALAAGIAVAVLPGSGGSPDEAVVSSSPKATAQSNFDEQTPERAASGATPAVASPAQDLARPRIQEHAAQLTLVTPAKHLTGTADEVVAVTDRMGGYVQSSNVAARTGAGEASFDLRIPASRLNETLAALSRLG